MNEKAVCLICLKQIALLKKYNLCCHYESLHADKNEKFQGLQKKREAE